MAGATVCQITGARGELREQTYIDQFYGRNPVANYIQIRINHDMRQKKPDLLFFFHKYISSFLPPLRLLPPVIQAMKFKPVSNIILAHFDLLPLLFDIKMSCPTKIYELVPPMEMARFIGNLELNKELYDLDDLDVNDLHVDDR